MWYPKSEAVRRLNSLFKLPATGLEQDWDLELSDAKRIDSFVDTLLRGGLDRDESKALLALILASFEDALDQGNFNEQTWNRLMDHVKSKRKVYKAVVSPWIAFEPDGQPGFKITERLLTALP